ncbi:MAG: cyclohexanone monooxygenase, partial [Beutenbergiaceae bacterium]
ATGFDAITGPLSAIEVIGRDGALLREVWHDGPRSYLGLATAGFPNLFTIGGPSSPGVISNVPPTLEHNAEWILQCLLGLRERGVTQIEAEEQAQEEWIAHVHELAQSTMYPHAKTSWYNGSNITGESRPFPVFTGGFDTYVDICADVITDDLRGFRVAN